MLVRTTGIDLLRGLQATAIFLLRILEMGLYRIVLQAQKGDIYFTELAERVEHRCL